MENQNDKKPPFKQNPFLVFAVFVILALLLFKMFSPNGGDSLTDKILGGSITKEITYNELKELISKGEIASVSIGQTYIKAYSLQTSPRIL